MATDAPLPDLNLNDLSTDALQQLVIDLLGTVATLEAKVAAQAEEIARLKKLNGRPKLKPSGMEKGTDPEPGPSEEKASKSGAVAPRPCPRAPA